MTFRLTSVLSVTSPGHDNLEISRSKEFSFHSARAPATLNESAACTCSLKGALRSRSLSILILFTTEVDLLKCRLIPIRMCCCALQHQELSRTSLLRTRMEFLPKNSFKCVPPKCSLFFCPTNHTHPMFNNLFCSRCEILRIHRRTLATRFSAVSFSMKLLLIIHSR